MLKPSAIANKILTLTAICFVYVIFDKRSNDLSMKVRYLNIFQYKFINIFVYIFEYVTFSDENNSDMKYSVIFYICQSLLCGVVVK